MKVLGTAMRRKRRSAFLQLQVEPATHKTEAPTNGRSYGKWAMRPEGTITLSTRCCSECTLCTVLASEETIAEDFMLIPIVLGSSSRERVQS
eukprot:509689-Amphidinium_carterae.1